MSDLISRHDAINCCSCLHPEECWDEIRKLPSAEIVLQTPQTYGKSINLNTEIVSDLISRQDAINALGEEPEIWNDTEEEWAYRNAWVEHISAIKSLPSADRPTTDCTKFMEWLKAEALDEENWELNAVANGEIICRKLKKLGWLDVEDGYYVDTRPTGEWTDNHNGTFTCDQCGCKHSKSNYCPNCGADMRGDSDD